MSLQGHNDIEETCYVCIPVPVMACTNFPSAHWRWILPLSLDYKKGKSQCSFFVFYFQVGGSVFSLGTKVNDDSNFCPMF